MAEEEKIDVESAEGQDSKEQTLEGGAYEVLRKRLLNLNTDLCDRLEKINQKRKEVFGGQDSVIIGNERVQTENNCLPRDIIGIGDNLIFGYNVFLGLRSETKISDVFNVYEFDGSRFKSRGTELVANQEFIKDFSEIYTFFKNVRFLQFIKSPGRLLLIFQVGKSIDDIKICRFKVKPDNTLEYIDNRGDLEYKLPPQHDFEWTMTTRDDQISGANPHVSIKDEVFVECIGGDLTIKIENNTASGEGIYSEQVEDPDQTLDDAQISYAFVDELILLKVLPYRENKNRYFVFNKKRETVARIDSIEQACVKLPEGHGIIFPKGYYLQEGDMRQFTEDVEGMKYLECVKSPNGEDFLYVFYHEERGQHILIQYNLISKSLANPILCHGYSLYEDGKMVLFNAPDGEPRRNHPMQIWETPFHGDNFEKPPEVESYFTKVGNRDLVRGVSEGYAISRLISNEHVTFQIYQDIIGAASDMLDGYHWLVQEEAFKVQVVVQDIRSAAIAAVDEFEKVMRIKANTEEQIKENQSAVKSCLLDAAPDTMSSINEFVESISEIRSRRGQVISLRELRYADMAKIDEMDGKLSEANEKVANACVDFLLRPDALTPYVEKNKDIDKELETVKKIADIEPLHESLEKLAESLDLLTDIVNNLQIEDATKTTQIVDSITDVYAGVNRTRATIRNLRKEIGKEESSAEFAAQFKLVTQSITNYIGMCDSIEKCDEYMTKVMINIEELEGKFADFDEYIEQLTSKREEAYAAFTGRKQVLDEEKKRKVGTLVSSAERILKSVMNRAESFKDIDEVNAYFASDLMVAKLRDIIQRLTDAGDTVKADDLTGRLKSSKDEIVRRLRDKLDLFDEGENVIKFGDYKFSVNTQPLELTTVYRDGDMYFHLTGSDFHEIIDDPEFLKTKHLWEQDLVSEIKTVYRGEYLAYQVLMSAVRGENGLTLQSLTTTAEDLEALQNLVREYSANLYTEGYEKGIHDHDAAKILEALVKLYNSTLLLRYDSCSRAHSIMFWCFYKDEEHKNNLREKMRSFGSMAHIFDHRAMKAEYVGEIRETMVSFFQEFGLQVEEAVLTHAAEYLYYELQDQEDLEFTINALAHDLRQRFMDHLKKQKAAKRFLADIAKIKDLHSKVNLLHDWISTYVKNCEEEESRHLIWEVVALLAAGEVINEDTTSISTYAEVDDLLGDHPLVQDKKLEIYFDLFLLKMTDFSEVRVPQYKRYVQLRTRLTEECRETMRLSEFKPKVMGAFVRNQLINDVYLNLVGANFAKQVGVVGEGKRTDLMGLLLLISPPGYGKTTLMEYIASRLGLTFMKINGPAIGHLVTSLDPAEAPNATAKEELSKLNLSLEMGNNVMIYLDDIQHVNPEFLQKFISLCDAQRKIEGVYKGKTRTYDLRGKKVTVVMAGNPYTESGEKFKIPDMLANRADTYNLGDISSTSADAFAMSFIENAMTSNPTLSPITTHSHEDIYRFSEVVKRGSADGIDFDYSYSAAEVNEIVTVLTKLNMVRDTVLKVNQQYIYSAAQQDDYRTEPQFKLQGSYRNMNRMAEKIFPVMTDEEVQQLIIDHYYNESQTLTTGAESNILKFKEMMNIMSDDDQDRWEQIKTEFNRRQSLAGVDDSDEIGKVIAQLSGFNANMGKINLSLDKGFDRGFNKLAGAMNSLGETAKPDLGPLIESMSKLSEKPVDVTPLVKAVEKMAEKPIDVTPLVAAVEKMADKPIDVGALVKAVDKIAAKKDSLIFPEEYSEAWSRQQIIFESLLPVFEKLCAYSENYAQLKDVLDKLIDGKIAIQINK